MKQLVKTTGPFSLILPSTGVTIQRRRPTVVPAGDHFVHARAAVGELKVLVSDLPDHATDAAWEATWKACEGDYNLALASFLAELNGEMPDEKTGESEADDAGKTGESEADDAGANGRGARRKK
jgi:hypothetical protein